MDMNGDTRSFDIVEKRVIEKRENPFGLTELEDKFLRRSLPAFLKSAVKYSGDLDCSLIDYRGYLACFEVPYREQGACDSYVWRMDEFMMGESDVFTRSDNSRIEMIEIMEKLLSPEHKASGKIDDAIKALSITFADVIKKFWSNGANLRKGNLDSGYVKKLIDTKQLPENKSCSEAQTEYCANIIRDSMMETQRVKKILREDLESERREMSD